MCSASARLPRFRLHKRVVPVLFGAAVLAVLTTGFVTVAPNRLVSGQPVGLFAATDGRLAAAIVVIAAAVLAGAASPPARARHRTSAVLAALLLLLALAAAGQAATALGAGLPRLARISLGAGFWILVGAAALALVDALQRAAAGPGERLVVAAALALGFALMARAGLFDALSLAHEYRTRHDQFAGAVLRHIVLVAAAVGPAVLLGFPLGVLAARRPPLQGPLFAVLNLLQTIPSIALFGLLIVPLSALAAAWPTLAAWGIGGIGPAPAIVALILYALLPVARNSLAGVAGVDPAVVDTARGMGMTRRQLLWRVELPLAAPLLIAGLRIVTVQAIGLAVVAALIGAGGLGHFVFEGLGQYAADLVLLGALPAIGLALAADFLLQT
ncbi:MAG TPA: ABC transporter permease, partial [Stellaceae bacterium]|nr:ABC transporter permease [Stellaceae bacterium]